MRPGDTGGQTGCVVRGVIAGLGARVAGQSGRRHVVHVIVGAEKALRQFCALLWGGIWVKVRPEK